MKIVCENIDRLITTESRLPSLVRGTTHKLYNAARQNHLPLTYQIAKVIIKSIKDKIPEKLKVGIFTGVWHPEHLPDGENDGPIGAVVLARTLKRIGARVTIAVENEVIPVIEALCEHLNFTVEIVPLSRKSEEDNAKLAKKLDSAIFIEKIGPSAKGVYHFATGYARKNQDAPLRLLLEKLNKKDKLTIGIGDMGNEIGFGKIYNAVREINPFGKVCHCEKEDGLATVLTTKYILPVGVSNIGAYGLVAALSLLEKNLDLLHKPEDELGLIKICTKYNCIDGGFGKAHDYVDGISAKSVAAYVQLLNEMVNIYFSKEKRGF